MNISKIQIEHSVENQSNFLTLQCRLLTPTLAETLIYRGRGWGGEGGEQSIHVWIDCSLVTKSTLG